jgi:hypothetical protein
MAGLVPAIHVFLDLSAVKRGCPGQPGHDELCGTWHAPILPDGQIAQLLSSLFRKNIPIPF